MKRTRGLLILGSHRCGTSMLAGLAALHGAFMGQTLPPGRNNPKGYWEHIGINEANENMLAHLQISWDWPFVLPPGWQNSLAPFGALRAQVFSVFRRQAFWALKDPRLCRLLPAWLPLFSGSEAALQAAVIFRHPESACRSLEKRDAVSRGRALALWLHHYVDAIHHLRTLPWIAVAYERMLAEPEQGMSELAEELKLVWPRTPSVHEIREFVDPALCHHPGGLPKSADWLETACYELYEKCKARHLRGADEDLARFAQKLHAQLDRGRGMKLSLIHEIYAETLRLRAYKLSAELALHGAK